MSKEKSRREVDRSKKYIYFSSASERLSETLVFLRGNLGVDGKFKNAQFLSLFIFFVFVSLSAVSVLLVSHQSRRQTAMSEGLFRVENYAATAAIRLSEIKNKLSVSRGQTGIKSGLKFPLNYSEQGDLSKIPVESYTILNINRDDRSQAETKKGTKVDASSLGLKEFPREHQSIFFSFEPDSQILRMVIGFSDTVIVAYLSPRQMAGLLTEDHATLFPPKTGSGNLDGEGSVSFGIVGIDSPLQTEDISKDRRRFEIPIYASDSSLINQAYVKDANIKELIKVSPLFAPTGGSRLLKYREGLGVAPIEGTNLTFLFRWLPAGTIVDSLQYHWLTIAFLVGSFLSVIFYVSAFAANYHFPVKRISECLGEMRRKKKETEYLSSDLEEEHVSDLVHEINHLIESNISEKAKFTSHVEAINHSVNGIIECSLMSLDDSHKMKWESSSFLWKKLSVKFLSPFDNSNSTSRFLFVGYYPEENILYVVFVSAHPIIVEMFRTRLTLWPHQRHLSIAEYHSKISSEFFERFSTEKEMSFHGSVFFILDFTSDSDVVSSEIPQNGAGTVRVLRKEEGVLNITVSELNGAFMRGLSLFIPDLRSATPVKKDAKVSDYILGVLEIKFVGK